MPCQWSSIGFASIASDHVRASCLCIIRTSPGRLIGAAPLFTDIDALIRGSSTQEEFSLELEDIGLKELALSPAYKY